MITSCACRVLLSIGLLALTGAKLPAQAEMPEQEIRQRSQRILDRAEFRYFEHLHDSANRPASRGGRSDGADSDGQAGSPGPGGSRRKSGKSRPGRGDGESSASGSGNEAANSSASSPALTAVGNVIGLIFHALAYLVLAAVCGLILYLIAQAVLSREPPPAPLSLPHMETDFTHDADHSPGELPADAYLQQARELAGKRMYREAIARLLLGGMSAIERAELIRHRRGLTFRDYLRALRGRTAEYDGFQSLIRLYEPVGFGRRVASFQTFQDALSGYERTVESLG